MTPFTAHIITPNSVFFEGEIGCISVPLSDGSMQFLAHHREELTTVTDGQAFMRTPDGKRVDFCTSGGVFYFDGREAFLMVEHAAAERDWNDKLQARAEYLRNEQARRRQSRQEHMLSTVALNKAFVAMHSPHKDVEN